jgi:chromosome partitioning protein
MIVVVGGVKGGTGKTTIATNLTVLRSAVGKKVLLVDADEQKSTSIWADQRDVLEIETKWTTVQLNGKAVYSQIDRMKADYDDIIIDVGGRETRSLRASIAVADLFLIPFKPRSLDIWTLGDIKTIISEMKPANPTLKCVALINQADSRGSDNEETVEILKNCEDIICFPHSIGNRKAFANAASDGLGINEMEVIDKKAVQEMKVPYDFIYTLDILTQER